MAKIHRNLCEPVIEALHEIFNEDRYTDRVLERIFKADKRKGARDRAFIAENTYEIVRWKRLLCFYAGIKDYRGGLAPLEFWKLLGVRLLGEGVELPLWAEFAIAPTIDELRARRAEALKARAVAESIPDWLDELCQKELGSAWGEEIKALNQKADVVVRVNSLKSTPEQVAQAFADLGVPVAGAAGFPEAVILQKRTSLFATEIFQSGKIEVQDASSQRVAPFLDVSPGLRVIDACAGAGGKTLHLAALMQNKGRIIALDTSERRLTELRKRASRAGADNIEVRLIDGAKTLKKLEKTADRLLLDVPCSGLGVLRRNPDAKWKLSFEEIDRVREIQRDILDRYPVMLKPGGLMVYATCSILPSEGEEQIVRFLRGNPGFKLVEEKRLSVAQDGFDGFYMARLQRVE